MFPTYLVIFLLGNIASMIWESVAKPPFGLSYVNKILTLRFLASDEFLVSKVIKVKLILVQYVHEFLFFKVIKVKLMLVCYVHEFLKWVLVWCFCINQHLKLFSLMHSGFVFAIDRIEKDVTFDFLISEALLKKLVLIFPIKRDKPET